MKRVAALLALAVVVCAWAAAGSADSTRDLSAYTGLGAWVDLYDPHVLAHPEAAVAAMARRGVATLYLETSNYQKRNDLVRRDRIARFVEAAHAQGIQVVAWYLPSFRDLRLDTRRSLAALRFETPGGERFDSFALDIEASVVRPASLRNARLLALSKRLRAAEPDLALGAIIPSPRGMQLLPTYWPGFPYAQLARTFDVFLPMGYFTYRTHSAGGTALYTTRNIALIRQGTADPLVPIHAIGGLARDASPSQVRAFVRSARAGGAIGSSIYDFADTTAPQWRELRAAIVPVTTG